MPLKENINMELPLIGKGDNRPEWLVILADKIVPTMNLIGVTVQQLDERIQKLEEDKKRPFVPPVIKVEVKNA